jgi:thymidylate synthase
MQFFIRDKKLQLKVNMRSCDLIYGASFDIPWFVFVHYAMFQVLKQFYPKLEMGKLIHNSASLHLYERHFKMLENIVNDPFTEYKSVDLGSVVDLKESLNIVR